MKKILHRPRFPESFGPIMKNQRPGTGVKVSYKSCISVFFIFWKLTKWWGRFVTYLLVPK